MLVHGPSALFRRFALFFGLIMALATACLVSVSAAYADATPAEATITVNGIGSAFVVPDVAQISIEVMTTGRTASGTRFANNRRTNAVLAALRRVGISRADIQTSGISLSHFQAGAKRHRHRVYAASNMLEVRVTEISLVGPAIDAASAAGADSVSGPDFSFTNPSAGKAQATRAALADARARADDAAAAVGYRVVGVRSIVIDPQPDQVTAGDAAPAPAGGTGKAGPPTPVAPGRREVDATVKVVFVIAAA